MKNLAMQRMRVQSHRQIVQAIAYHQQRLNLLSKTIDKQATCKYNAGSAFLLCAVNPLGPCHECSDYEAKGYSVRVKIDRCDRVYPTLFKGLTFNG